MKHIKNMVECEYAFVWRILDINNRTKARDMKRKLRRQRAPRADDGTRARMGVG